LSWYRRFFSRAGTQTLPSMEFSISWRRPFPRCLAMPLVVMLAMVSFVVRGSASTTTSCSLAGGDDCPSQGLAATGAEALLQRSRSSEEKDATLSERSARDLPEEEGEPQSPDAWEDNFKRDRDNPLDAWIWAEQDKEKAASKKLRKSDLSGSSGEEGSAKEGVADDAAAEGAAEEGSSAKTSEEAKAGEETEETEEKKEEVKEAKAGEETEESKEKKEVVKAVEDSLQAEEKKEAVKAGEETEEKSEEKKEAVKAGEETEKSEEKKEAVKAEEETEETEEKKEAEKDTEEEAEPEKGEAEEETEEAPLSEESGASAETDVGEEKQEEDAKELEEAEEAEEGSSSPEGGHHDEDLDDYTDGANAYASFENCTVKTQERFIGAMALSSVAADGTKCVFGVDLRDENKHCIFEDGKYGVNGWCYTDERTNSWGSCVNTCPLYGPHKILSDKLDKLDAKIDGIDKKITDGNGTAAATPEANDEENASNVEEGSEDEEAEEEEEGEAAEANATQEAEASTAGESDEEAEEMGNTTKEKTAANGTNATNATNATNSTETPEDEEKPSEEEEEDGVFFKDARKQKLVELMPEAKFGVGLCSDGAGERYQAFSASESRTPAECQALLTSLAKANLTGVRGVQFNTETLECSVQVRKGVDPRKEKIPGGWSGFFWLAGTASGPIEGVLQGENGFSPWKCFRQVLGSASDKVAPIEKKLAATAEGPGNPHR